MKLKIQNKINKMASNTFIKKQWFIIGFSVFIFSFTITGCSKFVEIDPPRNFLISKTVFDDPATVKSALASIYYKMREQGLVSGRYGLSTVMGIYSDELNYYKFNTDYQEYYGHSVIASNKIISDWWSHAYNIIYASNDIIKGITNSESLTLEDQEHFLGQALFIRAYIHSLLVTIYGDIPYISTTNYTKNNVVSRMPEDVVYDNIITDLLQAVLLLEDSDTNSEHVVPDKAVATALLARMYLYTEQWELAEETSSVLINNYQLESDITKVFLKGSPETLWQFKPNGITEKNTYESSQFIIQAIPGQTYALSQNIMDAFEPNDLRLLNWVGTKTSSDGLTTLPFAYKYKETINTTSESLEYSIIFRLAEQYFIRAESRTHLGNFIGAQDDLNSIRYRAGLASTPANSKEELLEAILHERQVELFTELGHRWFDLKRMGLADEVLSPIKPNWKPTDILLPLPETELEKNANLKPQNSGY